MANRFNVRPLFVPGPADLAREVARIETFPERVAAATSNGSFVVLHVSGLEAMAAMVLKQELLALNADCVISPELYLADRSARTDAVLMGTSGQYARLVPRLRHFPSGDLPRLAEEIERTLASVAGTPDPIEVAGTSLIWGERTYVMGILNITPDSFSGDGLAAGASVPGQSLVAAALSQARAFLDAGADLLDVGGESTRPGGMPVSVEEERKRVVPVVEALHAEIGVPISVDTYKAEVAAAALDAGASLVNDVWGLRGREGGWNEALARVVAEREVPLVLMHNRRAAATSGAIGGHYRDVAYADLMGEIVGELRECVAFAETHGISAQRIIVDPGIGFGKTPAQNVEVLRRLGELRAIGRPILLGTSRKSFIGRALNAAPDERVEGTAATVALGIQAGADIVRVHDVAQMVKVARMADVLVRPGAWERATASTPQS